MNYNLYFCGAFGEGYGWISAALSLRFKKYKK